MEVNINMLECTVNYIKDVLKHELQIRGYKEIDFKVEDDIMEVYVDGLKATVYHLDIFNPFDDIKYALSSVLRQLELEKIKRGDKM